MAKAKKVTKVVKTVKAEKKTSAVAPISLSASQKKEFEGLKTMSAKIRLLDSLNYTRGQIASFTGRRYQHVRNVLTTELKRKSA